MFTYTQPAQKSCGVHIKGTGVVSYI